jgi:hypothetical protein
MDWSPHDLRQCLLNPAYRPKPRKKGSGGPLDPTGTLQACVVVFHDTGRDAAAARARLEQTLQRESYRKPKNTAKADRARRMLAEYCRLAGADERTAVKGNPRARVTVAGERLPAGYDIVLHDPRGYVARTCIWSPTARPFTADELGVVAHLVVRGARMDFGADDGLDDDLGPGFAAVEIAELAHGSLTEVTAHDAAARAVAVTAIAGRALPAAP